MPKKKGKEQPKKAEVVKEPEPEEEVACPVCGKPVGLEVKSCPHCGAEFEEEGAPEEAQEPEHHEGGFVTPAKGAPSPPAEEETADCPVCGRAVSLDITTCPFCGAEFEEEEAPAAAQPSVVPAPVEPAKIEPEPVSSSGETADCPVCGKPVSLDVASCPYCGAEFEQEEVEEVVEEEAEGGFVTPAAEPPVTPGEEVADCPVCGKSVSLEASTCPFCGAEFEEEEVEEVIEVEEQPAAAPRAQARAEESEIEEVSEISAITPRSLLDLRVIGVALIILGIIGSQISVMIDWFWTWVPPIEDNLALFILLPLAVIIVGVVVFMLVKKAVSGGRKVPRNMPNISLSLLLFGVLALVLIMLWDPINSALQTSKVGVAGAFFGLLVVGVLAMFMGSRMTAKAST